MPRIFAHTFTGSAPYYPAMKTKVSGHIWLDCLMVPCKSRMTATRLARKVYRRKLKGARA